MSFNSNYYKFAIKYCLSNEQRNPPPLLPFKTHSFPTFFFQQKGNSYYYLLDPSSISSVQIKVIFFEG